MLGILATSTSSWLVSPTAPAPMLATRASSRQCLRMDASADALVSKLNDVFWQTKKAQMEAEMDQKLRDLEEFRAREQALYDTLSTNALSAAPAVPAIAGSSDVAAAELTTQMSALMAELSAEKARSAALEAELEDARLKAEIELQKVAAFWCASPAPRHLRAATHHRASCVSMRMRRRVPPLAHLTLPRVSLRRPGSTSWPRRRARSPRPRLPPLLRRPPPPWSHPRRSHCCRCMPLPLELAACPFCKARLTPRVLLRLAGVALAA